MADTFHSLNGQGRLIQPWISNLVRAWDALSAALLRADADPEESFELRDDDVTTDNPNEALLQPNQLRRNYLLIPPDNRDIRTIAQAAEILGILLGLCFNPSSSRRTKRMATFDNKAGQCLCFSGLPLLQVFSVCIHNIDNKDPGELYGTITADDGLNIEYLYNRTSSDPESIKPGQNASLTGPSQSILALRNFTIKLLLTDHDTFSWDDEIIHEGISWDADSDKAVYDKTISKEVESKKGSVTVNYAVLRNAVTATITITLEIGGEYKPDVYGDVYAHYDIWEDDPKTKCVLFKRSSHDYVDVVRWHKFPLLRSVVAVPLDACLVVTASLKNYNIIYNGDVIAKGVAEFPAKLSGTSSEQIKGKDGNYVTVAVYWTCQI